MSRFYPVSWKEFVKKLRGCGFSGPYYEGKHPYMIRRDVSLTIPNPHKTDISPDLISRILKQAGISREEWLDR